MGECSTKDHFCTVEYVYLDPCLGKQSLRNSYANNYKAKEVMFLVALVSLPVCLFVCLFVCGHHYSKSYERIGMKFYRRVLSSTRKN